MREVIFGALGAAALYGAIWVVVMPDPAVVEPVASEVAASEVAASEVTESFAGTSKPHEADVSSARPAARAASPRAVAQRPPVGQQTARAVTERPHAPPPIRADAPPAPGAALRSELPARLRETFDQLAELQRLGADPNRLAERMQTMQVDAQELRELRDFAERFVDVPEERVNLEQLR